QFPHLLTCLCLLLKAFIALIPAHLLLYDVHRLHHRPRYSAHRRRGLYRCRQRTRGLRGQACEPERTTMRPLWMARRRPCIQLPFQYAH
ncbi:hypothetical protein B0H11DRAFT_329208, partial [Mycena galericulata]